MSGPAIRAALGPTACHLPQTALTNAQLAQEYEKWDAEKIRRKTGIESRRVAAPGECASDLAFQATEKLFANRACRRDEVDFLLYCTQSPDYFLPATACTLQHRLGLPTRCGALDFNLGCSGFVYGLALAKGLIETAAARVVLLLTADTYTKYIHPQDRGTRTIFGDGAAATVIRARESEEELIGPFVFGTDGSRADKLIVPAGGHRLPAGDETRREEPDESGNIRSKCNLYMNGPDIMAFTLAEIPVCVNQLLTKTGGNLQSVDHFIFHQANKFLLESLRQKIGIPPGKFWMDMEQTGNTVSATIPIALDQAHRKGVLKPGHSVMLAGFGVGLSWAATMVRIVET
jgi:3-oxoacyl-[acyl-carrier-protein] synthase III